jgi:hypothetical protein
MRDSINQCENCSDAHCTCCYDKGPLYRPTETNTPYTDTHRHTHTHRRKRPWSTGRYRAVGRDRKRGRGKEAGAFQHTDEDIPEQQQQFKAGATAQQGLWGVAFHPLPVAVEVLL